MSKLTHANRVSNASKLAFFQAMSHPHGQTGGGLQVPVLQVGGGVRGLGQIDGADHRKVGYMTPELLAQTEAPPMANAPPAPLLEDPDQGNVSRQELVRQRMAILGNDRPAL